MPVIKGKSKHCRIIRPDTRYDEKYSINLIVADDIAEGFSKRGFFTKKEEEGIAIIFTRKVHGPNGIIRPRPKLLNQKNEEVEIEIGNGSDVVVHYDEYFGENNYGPYQGLDFRGLKILNLIEYHSKILEDGDELLTWNE